MSFHFTGVFSTGGPEVLAAFCAEFGGKPKVITDAFEGIGVELGWPEYMSPDDEKPAAVQYTSLLIDFSARYPDRTFVYLYATCFGGVCEYAGFAFRDGARIHNEPLLDYDVPDSYASLRRLVKHLGVDLGSRPFFAPLVRGYFDHMGPLHFEPSWKFWMRRFLGLPGPGIR